MDWKWIKNKKKERRISRLFCSPPLVNNLATTFRHGGNTRKKKQTKLVWFERWKKNLFCFFCRDFASLLLPIRRILPFTGHWHSSSEWEPISFRLVELHGHVQPSSVCFCGSIPSDVSILFVNRKENSNETFLKIHFPCSIALSVSLAHKSSIEWHYKDTQMAQIGLLTESLQWLFNALCHMFLIFRASALEIFISVTFLLPFLLTFSNQKDKRDKNSEEDARL